jgi:hypothetical protein
MPLGGVSTTFCQSQARDLTPKGRFHDGSSTLAQTGIKYAFAGLRWFLDKEQALNYLRLLALVRIEPGLIIAEARLHAY